MDFNLKFFNVSRWRWQINAFIDLCCLLKAQYAILLNKGMNSHGQRIVGKGTKMTPFWKLGSSWMSVNYLANLRKLNSKMAGVLHHQIKAKGISGTLGNAGWALTIIRGLVERCLKTTQILRPSSSLYIGSFHLLKKVLDCSKSLFRYFHYNALFGQPNKTDSLWTEGHQALESLTARG